MRGLPPAPLPSQLPRLSLPGQQRGEEQGESPGQPWITASTLCTCEGHFGGCWGTLGYPIHTIVGGSRDGGIPPYTHTVGGQVLGDTG